MDKIKKRQRSPEENEEYSMQQEEDAIIQAEEDNIKKKDKIKAKACKNFSIGLLTQAVILDWEEHEIARLVVLISKEREIKVSKILELLMSSGTCTPKILASLADEEIRFTSIQMISK